MVPFPPVPTYAFTLVSVNAERGNNVLKIGEKIRCRSSFSTEIGKCRPLFSSSFLQLCTLGKTEQR